MTRNQRLVFISLLAAQAVILSLIERAIPSPFAFAPGAKLGLANIITCIALFTLPLKDTVTIVITKLLLSTFLTGTISTLMYGASGSVLSLFGMYLVYQLGPKRVSLIGISITGAVLHNFGQLLMASFIIGTWTVLLYLPILTFVGILSGIAIGIAASYLLPHIRSLRFFSQPNRNYSQAK